MNTQAQQLCFRGEWRSYQKRVLDHMDRYHQDHRIHIVAPPGSGKTTLGIELICRLQQPCLILSPTLIIRSQWLQRVRDAFLTNTEEADALLSTDIKAPAFLTSITYQTLHSCMNRLQGSEVSEELEEQVSVDVDYSVFDLLQVVQEAGIKTICLDECHHLRSEWWIALEQFIKQLKDVTLISLTATPPYDSTPAQWERYIQLCGEIDEEIIVPELVADGSLCPHQDYVYLNFPSKEEQQQVAGFYAQARQVVAQLMMDSAFRSAIATHKGIRNCSQAGEEMLENPAYLSSLLIFFQQTNLEISKEWYQLLGVKKLPAMEEKWMEQLLQGFLFDDQSSYLIEEAYREDLIKWLKREHVIHRNKVGLVMNDAIEKLLINSKGKLDSIREIVGCEAEALQQDLRMLILSDYIRKEFEMVIGHEEKEINQLGVLPIFEFLRRAYPKLRLGVLCGSMVILPEETLGRLQSFCAASISSRPLLDEHGSSLGYAQVMIPGKKQEMVHLVTKVFEAGDLQVLVGTKSLLGEGWDSPCINALILASFVGSYVLSNQMRGRAIRTLPSQPDKTSNIWHLVCIANEKQVKLARQLGADEAMLSLDFATFQRRMDGFLGVSYDGTLIENSIERCTLLQPPYDAKHVKQINKEMKQLSANRSALRQQWLDALVCYEQLEVIEECQIFKPFLKPGAGFVNAVGLIVFMVVLESFMISLKLMAVGAGSFLFQVLLIMISLLVMAGICFTTMKLIRYLTPYRYLKDISFGLLEALRLQGRITSVCRIEVEESGGILYYAALHGATTREKDVFASCLEEFLGIVDNQRYLLYSNGFFSRYSSFYCVPSLFARTKEEAQQFQQTMKRYIGSYELAYTRSAAGRAVLMKARAKAFANRNERCVDRKKKVKSALE